MIRFLLTFAVLAAFSRPGNSADIVAGHNPDPRALAKTSSADLIQRGETFAGFDLDLTHRPKSTVLAIPAASESQSAHFALVDSVARYRLGLSYGLTRRLELAVSASGTQEKLVAQDMTTYEFAGGAVVLKAKLIDAGPIKIAATPFFETGAGETASKAYSRAVTSRGGWLAAVTVANDFAALDLNGGIRYRANELVDSASVSNELFARMQLSGQTSRRFRFFAGLERREFTISDAAATSVMQEIAADSILGVQWRLDEASVAAYHSRPAGKYQGFSSNERAVGMQISWLFGKKDSQAAEIEKKKAREVIEAQEKQAREKKDAETALAQAPTVKTADEIENDQLTKQLQFEPENFDYLTGLKSASGGRDDFSDVESELDREAKNPVPGSNIGQVDAELAKIKEAEAKQAAENERKALAEENLRRQQAAEDLKADALNRSKWMKQAGESLKGVGKIGRDELEWEGLGEHADEDPLLEGSFSND